MRTLFRSAGAMLLPALLGTAVLASAQDPAPAPAGPAATAAGDQGAVFVGAGDIGHCAFDGAERTAALLDDIPGTVFTVGDHAYSSGTHEEFLNCYDPWWGRHKDRTRPVPGNHDYETPDAEGYFTYFGERAGAPGAGYYHFTLGGWNIYALNSAVPADVSSAQYNWLEAELTSNPSTCSLAYWHMPVRTSGRNGDTDEMLAVWSLLQTHGAEVVLSGHEHHYERFAPLNTDFFRDDARGIREFVVGTGGGSRYGFATIQPHSEFRLSAWGVLKLTLRPSDYSWEFIAASDRTIRDSGTTACH